jgi:hypothetical protein
MPSPTDILAGLTRAANQLSVVAIVWHIATFVALAALLAGFRPQRRAAALLLTLPLGSVAVVALALRNPFNAAVFAALAAALAMRARHMGSDRVASAGRWATGAGAALVAFGTVYPHFLAAPSLWMYALAAPLGLVPCPSLAVVVGFTLLAGGFGDRIGSLLLASVALFYGVFGVARLGVRLDYALVAGALALATLALRLVRVATPPSATTSTQRAPLRRTGG